VLWTSAKRCLLALPFVQPHPPRSLHQRSHRHHACMGGWVFVGYIDEDGEEREASYRCRRCAASR
jgi:hypothetical protein